ncbi:hypothetical protein, partial [Allofournierella massiliensis]|uniref:hypothetical protein n=1 Tax=Allofournierella massiliensis TaxID=1650663 RepID=UPI001A9BC085
ASDPVGPYFPNLQIPAVLDFLRSLPAFLSPHTIIPLSFPQYEKKATFRWPFSTGCGGRYP